MPQASRGDLRVSLKIDPGSALQFETVNAYVTVLNYDGTDDFIIDSDQAENKARVSFVVERKRDEPVRRINDSPVLKKMKVAPGERQDFVTDISLYYDMTAVGRYTIKAVIEAGGIQYESNPVLLDIVRGIDVCSVTRGVAGYSEQTRNYTLRYWARNKKEYLFLCVDEDSGKTSYGVFLLGPVIRVIKPILDVARDGGVKVLHQVSPDCFVHSRFESNADGVFFVDQSYRDSDGAPYRR